MVRQIYTMREILRLGSARLRALAHGLFGVMVGPKCLLGRGVRIERPWNVRLGSSCVLEPEVWIDIATDQGTFAMGDYSFIGRGTHFLITEGVSIGSHVLIGDGVVISDHKHNNRAGELIGNQGCNSAPVVIGNDVLLSVKCVILQGVTIGDGAIVGPGAVVTTDVSAYSIVSGLPARLVGKREE